MRSIIGHRIDYKGVGVLRGQRHIPSKNRPKYPRAITVVDDVDVDVAVDGYIEQYEGMAYVCLDWL